MVFVKKEEKKPGREKKEIKLNIGTWFKKCKMVGKKNVVDGQREGKRSEIKGVM